MSSLDRSLHQKRRQELVISLHKCMSDIFDFIISTIQQQLGGHTSNVSLIQAALNALSAYLDWAELDCVFGQDRIILRLLTHLLTEKSHQMLAADCLLTVVKRKVLSLCQCAICIVTVLLCRAGWLTKSQY